MVAPAASAWANPASRSAISQPPRSVPKGYGTGVVNPKTDRVPTGDRMSWDRVVLGVGVTCVVAAALVVPPKVDTQLCTNVSKSAGST